MTGEELIRDALSNCNGLKRPHGVEIIPSKPQFINYEEVKVKKFRRKLDEDIGKWVSSDFVSYAKQIHLKVYKTHWILNFSACCQEILLVKDALVDNIGFCDNIVLRDYIDFFFDSISDFFIKKSQSFYFSQMRKLWVLSSFLESYDYESQVMGTKKIKIKKEPKNDVKNKINERDVDNIYILNWDRFVMSFGAVVCINWLMTKKSFSYKQARKFVLDICEHLHAKNMLNDVVESTIGYSPYPNYLKFQFVEDFFHEIGYNEQIDIIFKESDGRLDFLRG